MRANLLALGLLLMLVALACWDNPSPKPKIEWEASFWLEEPNGFGCQWLDFEDHRYRLSGTGCTGARVFERGRVERSSGHLELFSDEGGRREYTLDEEKWGASLRDPQGQVYPERNAEMRRLHPEADWLRTDVPLELDGIRIGMNRDEALQVYPRALPDADGSLAVYPYSSSHNERVTIHLNGGLVDVVGGLRLSQAGRPLLNTCSTRRDIECLFGRLSWTKERPDSFGVSEKARWGGLEIQVHSLVGMTPDEAFVVNLRLSR